MSLPRHLFAPAFRHHHMGRSFSAIVGIMVFIATFATAAEAALLALGYQWGQTMETRITVEIPATGDEASMPQAERVKQATAALRAIPDVGLVMPLSDEEVERLLHPWFSQTQLLKSLPLPTLIDVERKTGRELNVTDIQNNLKSVVSDARVDDHGEWTQDVWRLIHGLSALGGLMIFLTALTLVIAVSLICRAVMGAEHETISLLHLLGTEDRDIARHFQLQAERLSLQAASIGFIAALTITGGLLFATRHIIDLSILDLKYWAGLGVMIFAIPVSAIAIAASTARLSVLNQIKGLP